jgi:hypothetical protein
MREPRSENEGRENERRRDERQRSGERMQPAYPHGIGD